MYAPVGHRRCEGHQAIHLGAAVAVCECVGAADRSHLLAVSILDHRHAAPT